MCKGFDLETFSLGAGEERLAWQELGTFWGAWMTRKLREVRKPGLGDLKPLWGWMTFTHQKASLWETGRLIMWWWGVVPGSSSPLRVVGHCWYTTLERTGENGGVCSLPLPSVVSDTSCPPGQEAVKQSYGPLGKGLLQRLLMKQFSEVILVCLYFFICVSLNTYSLLAWTKGYLDFGEGHEIIQGG